MDGIREVHLELFGNVSIRARVGQGALGKTRVHSQQVERVYRVAWVASTSPLCELVGASPHHPYARAFLDGLRNLGYIDGKTLVIELRSAGGKLEALPEF
jgi:hypothetical protein